MFYCPDLSCLGTNSPQEADNSYYEDKISEVNQDYFVAEQATKYNLQLDEYQDYILDKDSSRFALVNIASLFAINQLQNIEKFKFYLTDQNSIYFKISFKSGYRINAEVFLDNDTFFYSIYEYDKLIEEDMNDYHSAIESIIINHLSVNSSTVDDSRELMTA